MRRPRKLFLAALSAAVSLFFLTLAVVSSAAALAACGGADLDPVALAGSDMEDTWVRATTDTAWTMWGYGPARTRVGPAVGLPEGGRKVDALWLAEETTPRQGGGKPFGDLIEYPPSIAYGAAFYCTNGGGAGGEIVARSLTDGSELWRTALDGGGQFASQPAISNRTIYVGTMKPRADRGDIDYRPQLLALKSATGEPQWGPIRMPSSIESSPLIVGKRLFVCTQGGGQGNARYARLYCFDKYTGKVLWRNLRPKGFKYLGGKTTSSPTFADGMVFVATYTGTVWAFNAESGKVRWKRAIGGDFYGTPAVSGRRLIVASKSSGRIFCLDTRSGKTLWLFKTRQATYASPAIWNNLVLIGSCKGKAGQRTGGAFRAIDLRKGKLKWKQEYPGPIFGSATVLNGVVYFSYYIDKPRPHKDVGKTIALDARTGSRVLWELADGCYSPITATRDVILVTGHHTIYAFRPQH